MCSWIRNRRWRFYREVQSQVRSIESRENVHLRNYADCSDFIKSAKVIKLDPEATCPNQTENYIFTADALPSTMYDPFDVTFGLRMNF